MDKNELKLEMAKLKYERKSKKVKSNRKGLYAKIFLALVVIIIVGFTIGTLGVYWHTGSEPKILIGAFFSFFGSEIWILAKIKKDKTNAIKKTTEEMTEEDNR